MTLENYQELLHENDMWNEALTDKINCETEDAQDFYFSKLLERFPNAELSFIPFDVSLLDSSKLELDDNTMYGTQGAHHTIVVNVNNHQFKVYYVGLKMQQSIAVYNILDYDNNVVRSSVIDSDEFDVYDFIYNIVSLLDFHTKEYTP